MAIDFGRTAYGRHPTIAGNWKLRQTRFAKPNIIIRLCARNTVATQWVFRRLNCARRAVWRKPAQLLRRVRIRYGVVFVGLVQWFPNPIDLPWPRCAEVFSWRVFQRHNTPWTTNWMCHRARGRPPRFGFRTVFPPDVGTSWRTLWTPLEPTAWLLESDIH